MLFRTTEINIFSHFPDFEKMLYTPASPIVSENIKSLV